MSCPFIVRKRERFGRLSILRTRKIFPPDLSPTGPVLPFLRYDVTHDRVPQSEQRSKIMGEAVAQQLIDRAGLVA